MTFSDRVYYLSSYTYFKQSVPNLYKAVIKVKLGRFGFIFLFVFAIEARHLLPENGQNDPRSRSGCVYISPTRQTAPKQTVTHKMKWDKNYY